MIVLFKIFEFFSNSNEPVLRSPFTFVLLFIFNDELILFVIKLKLLQFKLLCNNNIEFLNQYFQKQYSSFL